MSVQDTTAREIVKRYSMYSAAAGLIPMPWVDMAAITAVQLKMLAELGKVYNVPFESDRVKPIVASLLRAYASTEIGYGAGASLLKAIPLVGGVLSAVSVPAFASGFTYAVGKVFITHFASGGTFLDFNPDETRAFFATKPTVSA